MYMRQQLFDVLCSLTLDDFQSEEEMKAAIALRDLLKATMTRRGRRKKVKEEAAPTVGE